MADRGLGFTRLRDLAAVFAIAGVAGYLLVALNYSRLPALPRLAGVTAALLGAAEAIAGVSLRSRLTAGRDADGRPRRPPVHPLAAARAVTAAKATSLAAAALAGLWTAVLLYVAPRAAQIAAARTDEPAAVLGVLGALVMAGGALFLESCLRTPIDRQQPPDRRR